MNNWFSRFRRIILSWDFLTSLFVLIIISYLIPELIPLKIMASIYEVSITVFSLLFSIFFSSLAIIISSGDNSFVNFLEQDGSYSEIIWAYKITLISLFSSLVISIFLYVLAQEKLSSDFIFVPKWVNLIFALSTIYSLLATFESTFDVLRYAKYRAKYIKINKKAS